MKHLADGSILIQGAIDGPFEPLFGKRVRGADLPNPDLLLIHQIKDGRPQDLDHAAKQERIKALIKEMRSRVAGMTFAQAWERLQKTRPDLFDMGGEMENSTDVE